MAENSGPLKRAFHEERMEEGGTTRSSKPRTSLPQLRPGWEPGARKTHICRRCADIDFSRLVPGRPGRTNGAVRLGTASQIVSDNSCPMCQLLSRNFIQKLFRSKDVVNYLYPFHTSHIQAHKWVYSHRLHEVSDTTSFAIVEARD